MAVLRTAGLVSLLLRIGLAVVFLYAVVGATLHPADWVGYLPLIVRAIAPVRILLPLFSLSELFLSLWLLSGIRPDLAGVVALVILAGIVIVNLSGLDIIFRDFGLIFMAAALVVESRRGN